MDTNNPLGYSEPTQPQPTPPAPQPSAPTPTPAPQAQPLPPLPDLPNSTPTPTPVTTTPVVSTPPTPQITPQPTPNPLTASATPPTGGKKSKMIMIAGIVLGLIVLAALVYFLLPLFKNPDSQRKEDVAAIAKDINAYAADPAHGLLPYSIYDTGSAQPVDPESGFDYIYVTDANGLRGQVCATLSDDSEYCVDVAAPSSSSIEEDTSSTTETEEN